MKKVCCEVGRTRVHAIAAIILNGKRVLSVREKDTEVWLIPGGGHKSGETHEETLKRELWEELSVALKEVEFFGQVIEPAIWEDGEVAADIYFAKVEGKPIPSSEIVEIKWFEAAYPSGEKMGSILRKRVIPELVAKGIL